MSIRIIIAAPIGIAAVIFFIIGNKRLDRFFMMDYQENAKGRFRDNFIGNVYFSLAATCLVSAVILFDEGIFDWTILPFSLCLGAFILPVGILGAYWHSYMMNKLWGGFMPVVREKYGYAEPQITAPLKIDSSKFKIPRKIIVIALSVAFFVFLATYFVLYTIGWNGSIVSGIIFRLFTSGLMAFSIFMTITSVSLSRRIQKLRSGEFPADDDDN